MGLFLVLFWCSAVTGDILRYNSRFGVFNSRLGRHKFPFPLLRELVGKGLICLTVFAAKTTVIGRIEKIPGSTGITGNFAATDGTSGSTAYNGADLRCPGRSSRRLQIPTKTPADSEMMSPGDPR